MSSSYATALRATHSASDGMKPLTRLKSLVVRLKIRLNFRKLRAASVLRFGVSLLYDRESVCPHPDVYTPRQYC